MIMIVITIKVKMVMVISLIKMMVITIMMMIDDTRYANYEYHHCRIMITGKCEGGAEAGDGS